MRTRIASLALLLACTVAAAKQPMVISGRVTGANGKPMRKAHVHLADASQAKPFTTIETDKEGTFKISTEKTGLLFLQVSGVDHSMREIPILVERPEEAKLDVRLAANPANATFDDIRVVGDFNNFSFESGIPMHRESDGVYTAEIPTTEKTFAYELLGVVPDRSVNGTESEDFVYDGSGDYRSIITPKGGKVRVVFDPKKVVREDGAGSVTFRDPRSNTAQLSLICSAMTGRQAALIQAMQDFVKKGGSADMFKADQSKERAELESSLASEHNPLLRQALLISYASLIGPKDSTLMRLAFKEIPPASALWALSPPALYAVLDYLPEKERNNTGINPYIKRVIDASPSTTVRSQTLFVELLRASQAKRKTDVETFYKRLTTDFPKSPYTAMARTRFAPDAAIQTGKSVPTFSFASLDSPGTTYTNESFRGKYYLIDFWATWCGPCRQEMKALHAAYDKYHGRNFEILSLSFDAKPEDITSFRGRTWKMPWKHAFIDGGFNSSVAKTFEVAGIPRPILVDGNGRIVATEDDLRGANLDKTLAQLLGTPQ